MSTAAAFLDSWPAFAQLLHSCYVDEMANTLTVDYGLWPERFFLLRDGVVAWASTLTDEVPGSLHEEMLGAAQQIFAS